MSTVLRFDGSRVVIYPNDHRPAHVHVKGAEGETIFALNCPGEPPTLRDSFGFPRPALKAIVDELARRVTALCGFWESVHGPH